MLFNFVLAFITSDLAAAAIGAYLLWHLRSNAVAKWVGILLTMLLIDGLCQITAYSYRPRHIQIDDLYTLWITIGRLSRSSGIWLLVLYLNRFQKSSVAAKNTSI